MRQESMFDPAARSPADARGLMQLLPSTAERTARRHRPAVTGRTSCTIPTPTSRSASRTCRSSCSSTRATTIKALAAYNGGPDAVAKWESRFGHLPPDEFVENITYRETRDYVKRVLGNYRRYQIEYVAR